ncbi:hypothetical protein AQ860_11350 [Burkholderia pseudomallei]|nr:hypothetical protein AQ760_17560 [Burkholderia pseudomallei]OMZ16423.1 hypothetical protein AQ859_13090 [Burkholderia pseudomallei]OMZ37312.1 hypothetical protein AQ860_11350 [Burkholderia pseudomallei]
MLTDAFGNWKIGWSGHDEREGRFTIAAATSNLLIEAVQGLRHACVNHTACMSVVDAQPKRRCADDDIERAFPPVCYDPLAGLTARFAVQHFHPIESRIAELFPPDFSMLHLCHIENCRPGHMMKSFHHSALARGLVSFSDPIIRLRT